MKLLIIFAIACSIPALEAIKCYQCDTMANKNCEKGNDEYLKACPIGLESCAVAQMKLPDGNTVTHRTCLPKRDDGCEKINNNEGCVCNQDACNKSNIVNSSVISLLALFLVIVHNGFYS